ncbi:MAG: hypothetical protein AAFO07_30550 [Bacteroidota bacterium]
MPNKMTKVIRGLFMPLLKRPRLSKKVKKEPKTKVLRSHNLELSKSREKDYVNRKQDERFIKDLKSASKGLFVTGEKEGSLGIPIFDINQPSATIQEWTAKCLSLKKQILSQIEYNISQQKATFSNLEEVLTESTRDERIEYAISQLRWKREKRWLRNPFKKRKIAQTYKEEIEQLTDLIKQEEAEIHDLIRNKYHQVHPKKRLTDYTFLYIVCLLTITLGEFPLNVTALQHLGEFSNIFVLILSGFFAMILGFAAHSTGHALLKKHTKEWVAAISIGLAVCAIVGVLRASLEGSFVMSLMNVLIFAFGCFISYERARNLAFWSSVRRKKRLQKRKNKIHTAWIRDMERYRPEAEKEVRQQEDELKQAMNAIGTTIASIEAYKNNIEHRIDGILAEGSATYRNANSLSRLKAGHKPVLIWENKQHNFFNNYNIS